MQREMPLIDGHSFQVARSSIWRTRRCPASRTSMQRILEKKVANGMATPTKGAGQAMPSDGEMSISLSPSPPRCKVVSYTTKPL